MSNESTVKTVVVATVLSVVCSIALAAAVTLLKPIQAENRELEKQRKILSAASILEEGKGNKEEVNKLFAGLERYLVTIDSGEFRKVELLKLVGCMDKKAKNYKTYYEKDEPAACRY